MPPGRKAELLGAVDEFKKKIALHDIGVKEDILAVFFTHVPFDALNALLAVEIQSAAAEADFTGIVNALIEKRDIGAACDMLLKECAEILAVYDVAGRDDDIFFIAARDMVDVFRE